MFMIIRFVGVGDGLIDAEKQDGRSLDFNRFAIVRTEEMSKAVGAYGVRNERVKVVNKLEQGVVA